MAALWRWRVGVGYAAGLVTFLVLVSTFYLPGLGFTSLLSIGSRLEGSTVARLKAVPHYVYEDSHGYDGAYYVQLALHPTLSERGLENAIDNLPYRARRMLPSWTAWVLGLGRAAWVVQVFALLNVAVWLALAWVLMRWLPPTSWSNLLRWGGVLFSHGMCMSVRNSLVDAPGLLLVALAVWAVESGRRPGAVVALASAVLTKETSVLAASALMPRPGGGVRAWARAAGLGVLVVAPFAAWLGYVRWRAGPVTDPGLGNFTWPLAGLAEKCGVVWGELAAFGAGPTYVGGLLVVTALIAQAFFFLLWRQPSRPWWRVGASFAVLLTLIGQPVWEGYPGAATRVLLPMTLAFNVLVPRSRRWLPLLVLGNLSAVVGVNEFNAPHESFRVTGETALARFERGAGWFEAEAGGGRKWRWSSGRGQARIVSQADVPLHLRITGALAVVKSGRLILRVDGVEVWSDAADAKPRALGPVNLTLAPRAALALEFATDEPGVRFANGDTRLLAFAAYDVEIAVARVPVATKPAAP